MSEGVVSRLRFPDDAVELDLRCDEGDPAPAVHTAVSLERGPDGVVVRLDER
jgi:hypothetical protein